jgi:hypothetical protein
VNASLQSLRRRVSPLGPGVIVIYQATNDMSDELRDLARARGIYKQAKVDKERSWLTEHSVLWDLVEKNLRIIASQQRLRRV